MSTDEHDVYAQQLFRCGQGYPLWVPEPSAGEVEVEIGDVGYLHRGSFCRLFNAIRDADDTINEKVGVPHDFEQFARGNLAPQRVENAIDAGPLASMTLRKISVSAEGQIQGIGAGCQYECTADRGALLVLETPATREELHQVRRMKNYMSRHIQSWQDFANGLGLEVGEDLLFVKGWVKTTRWAVAAFTNQAKSAKLNFNGNFGLPATASFSLSYDQRTAASCIHKSGPKDRQIQDAWQHRPRNNRRGGHNGRQNASPVPVPAIYPADQCVFLHYLKLKKRFILWDKFEAAAEPQDPSGASDDESLIEEVPPRRKPYDPVDYLLDYILRNSEADVAVAGDQDLVDICMGFGSLHYTIPDDIPAFLEHIRPSIEVTADGLGMLSTEAPMIQESSDEGSESVTDAMDTEDDDLSDLEPENILPQPVTSVPTPKLFNLSATLLELPQEEHRGSICALAFSPDGVYVAGGFEDSSIIVWYSASRRRACILSGHSDPICSLEFAPDSRKLASGSRDACIIIWNVADGSQSMILVGHTGFVNSVAYSPEGRLIASASVDFSVKLWNAETGEAWAQDCMHDAMVMSVLFSPDGSKLVSVSADCVARIWNPEDGSQIAELDSHEGVIYSVAFSLDGRRLVTSSDDGTTRIWNAISGGEFVTLREQNGSIWAAAFSDDGMRVITVASERTINICDSYSGEVLNTIEGGDRLVNAATFSANGEFVSAGGEDHSVNVWNTKTGQSVASFPGHTDNISRLRFSSDGRFVVSASDDSTVRLFDLREHVAL